MAHVGIERLGAGHCQDDGAKRKEGAHGIVQEEARGVGRTCGGKYFRMGDDLGRAEAAGHHEPQQHDRAEHAADPLCAETLRGEQQHDQRQGQRQHPAAEARVEQGHALDRR